MKTFKIGLPLTNHTKQLEALWEMLKSYEGRQVEDKEIFSKKDTLINFHVGAVNSFLIGYIPLAINYRAENHSYIASFSNLKVTLEKDKIICEGVLTRNGINVKYEYNFI